MSTMYDALKKAEAERKKNAGGEETTVVGKEGSSNAQNSEKIKIALLSVAVIIVFAIAFYRFNAGRSASNSTVTASSNQPIAAPAVNGPIVTAPASVKPQRAAGSYGLDGIINAGENSMAIINGKLLKPEQSIDNLILKKISPKEVELLNTKDNTTVTLKIN